MISQRSLVIFTLMVQCAVGGVWCLQAAFLWNSNPGGVLYLKIQLLAALGLVLAGLAAAMTHLGRPGESRHAVKNLKGSWLSREIISVNILAGVLVIMTGSAYLRPGVIDGWWLLPGSLAGAVTLCAMTRVYRLRTVPSWNHAGTPLAFLGSALILGGVLGTLVLTMPGLLQVAGHEPLGPRDLRSVALIAVLAGFILEISASGVKPSGTAPAGPLIARQPVLQGAGVVLGAVHSLTAGNPNLQLFLLLSAVFCLTAGEIVQRNYFYRSYQRVGL